MKKGVLFLIIWTLLPLVAYSQSDKLEDIKLDIENLGRFDSGEEGRSVAAELRSLSKRKLSKLILAGKPLEKIYAFWAYCILDDSDYRLYFPKLVNDRSIVKHTQVGCIVSAPKEVGSYVFDIAENLNNRFGSYKNYPRYLDSMALEVEFYQGIRGNINCRLMNFEAPLNLYDKIRRKAISGDIPATIGLASYQNKQDIPIIKEHLKPDAHSILYGLMCVEKFPDEEFKKDVLAIYYSKMNQQHPLIFNFVCELLRKYNSNEVDEAFNELIKNPDKYYFQIIGLWYSFEKNKEYEHPIRKELIEELGMTEIEKRLEKYQEMNYWKIASKENKN